MAYSVTQTCLFSEENKFNSCYLMVVKIVPNALAMMIFNGLLIKYSFSTRTVKEWNKLGTVSANSLQILKKKLSIYYETDD